MRCCCCCCCCCCCSHINSHNQVRGHRTGSSQLRNTPGINTHNPRWYTHISHLTQWPHQKHIKVKSGISLRCARSRPVHTSHYSRLEKPHIYSDCHLSKTTTYISHVVSVTTHTHDRHKSIGEKDTRKRKEDKGKESKEKKNETTRRKRQAKSRKRQETQEKTRQERKERRREKKKKQKQKQKQKKEKYHASRP